MSLETDVEYLSEAVTEVVPISVVSAGSVSMTVLAVSDSDITSEELKRLKGKRSK